MDETRHPPPKVQGVNIFKARFTERPLSVFDGHEGLSESLNHQKQMILKPLHAAEPASDSD